VAVIDVYCGNASWIDRFVTVAVPWLVAVIWYTMH
jgi:hypothetical protein